MPVGVDWPVVPVVLPVVDIPQVFLAPLVLLFTLEVGIYKRKKISIKLCLFFSFAKSVAFFLKTCFFSVASVVSNFKK